MKIFTHYADILHRPTKPVKQFDQALRVLALAMREKMISSDGIGLAANQVGENSQILVTGYKPLNKKDHTPAIPFHVLVNPKIISKGKKEVTIDEGCLSLPGLELPVSRADQVVVRAVDETNKPKEIRAKGLFAHVLQHEIDHLNGILFPQRSQKWADLKYYRGLKIVFFGSDDFSLPVLQALVENKMNIFAIVTETDKPSGRGGKVMPTLVKEYADKLELPVFQPIDKLELGDIISQLQPDLIVLASYGKIIPAQALAVPPYGSLNLHPSLLPRHRGATPIQSAILSGDEQTGVTLMEMVATVDAGRIVSQEKLAISPTDTTSELRQRLAQLAGLLLVKQLPAYLSSQANLTAQDPKLATATIKFCKESGEINWNDGLKVISRQIRALNPWPGTYTSLSGKLLKILAAHMDGERLILDQVQLEGKKPARWDDFRRGYLHLLTKEEWFGKIN